MAIFFYKDSNNDFVLGNSRDDLTPAGNYELESKVEGSVTLYAIKYANREGFKIPFLPLSEYLDSNGNAYTSIDALKTAVSGFFVNAPGGGTGGTSVSLDHIFESVAARDSYFTARPQELITATPIIVQHGTPQSPNVRFEVWGGANQPSSYDPVTDAASWVDAGATGLTLAEATILQTIAAMTDGFFPIKTTNGFGDSSLQETVDALVSSKSLMLPGGSAGLGPQLLLSDAGANLVYRILHNGRVRVPVVVEYDSTGTVTNPFATDFSSEEIRVILQPDNTGVVSGTKIVLNYMAQNNAFVTKGYLKVGATAPSADVTIKGYLGSEHPDNLLIEQTIPSASFSANTEFSMDFDYPIGFFNGQAVVVTLESSASFDLEADVTNTNIWFAVDRQVGTFHELARKSDIQAGIGIVQSFTATSGQTDFTVPSLGDRTNILYAVDGNLRGAATKVNDTTVRLPAQLEGSGILIIA